MYFITVKGSFRVTQKIALRATTAAPTFFKPLLSFDELYVDGGIVASNPTAVAVHEARTIFPDVSCMNSYLYSKFATDNMIITLSKVPLELIVSVGTGGK
jgi:patatin-like phospholipase/acyl hydrolase